MRLMAILVTRLATLSVTSLAPFLVMRLITDPVMSQATLSGTSQATLGHRGLFGIPACSLFNAPSVGASLSGHNGPSEPHTVDCVALALPLNYLRNALFKALVYALETH